MIFEAPDMLAFKPKTPQGQRVYWTEFLERNGRHVTPDHRTVDAYVSDNRWLADCPSCGAGIHAWSENPECCCLLCGHLFAVRWPADKSEAEQVLEERPPSARHWQPWGNHPESVDKLERENELMRDVDARPQLSLVESPRQVFTVDGCGPDLDDEVLRWAETGYVIRHDMNANEAEVELQRHSDVRAKDIKQKILGK